MNIEIITLYVIKTNTYDVRYINELLLNAYHAEGMVSLLFVIRL